MDTVRPGLHFSVGEFAKRRHQVADELVRRNLDGLLMFRQESMYYLTGYDSFGYVFFQCLYMAADGETMMLIARPPDLRQAQYTSVIKDIRVWEDSDDADPAQQLRQALDELGSAGQNLGIETDAYGLTGFNLKRVEAALDGFSLTDASDVVSRARAVKSAAELEYVQKAADLADLAFDQGVETAGPAIFEGDVLAAQQAAIFRGGGDYPANDFIIGSGPRALLLRSSTGMRTIDKGDQLTMEWAGVYRHYHAAMMRTILVGPPSEYHRELFATVSEAIEAMTEALTPGRPIGEVDETHRRVLDAAGHSQNRFTACGYSQGATFAPNWMDWPMLFAGNPVIAVPGMVFFLHCVIVDSRAGAAMTYGHTCVVTETGRRVLSARPLELVTV